MIVFIFMLSFRGENFISNLGYVFGIDIYSWLLLLLTCWILPLILMSRIQLRILKKNYIFFMFLLILMELVLLFTFRTTNIIFFYISFESSLIPIFILIFGWGYQPERFQAGLYILFYTLFASLPLLALIVRLGGDEGRYDFFLLIGNYYDFNLYIYVFFFCWLL